MRKIKFCHLIDSSGSNPLLFNLIKYSDRNIFEYTVLTLEPEGSLQADMKEIGVKTLALNCSSRRQYPSVIKKLREYFKKEKFDILQVHSFEGSFVGLVAARLAGIPVRIFTGHHSHEVPLYKNNKLIFVDSFLCRRLATNVISPSVQMKEIFMDVQKVPEHRIEVIPHGMDIEAWRESADRGSSIRKEYGLEDKLIFGAVGRLFWVKDFETLIRAFARVAENRKDIALLIAGGGSDEDQLRETVRSLKMEEQIILTGRREDIAAVMSEFDVFVHTALAESFGLVYIEAFALGKPIISTPVGEALELVTDGETGFLFETGDEKELVSVIEKMLEIRAEWNRMGEKCRKISEDYAIRRTQKICDDFYASLVKN